MSVVASLATSVVLVSGGDALAQSHRWPGDRLAPNRLGQDPFDRFGPIMRSDVPARGHLGVAPLAISRALRQALGAPSDRGVLVDELVDDSPAAKGGIAVGDVITDVDGKPVTSRDDILDALSGHKKGDVVEVRTLRDKVPFVRWAKLESDVRSTLSLEGSPQTF